MSLIDDAAMEWVLQRAEQTPSDAALQAFQVWFDTDVRHKGAYVRALAIHNAVSRATVQENLRPGGAGLALAMPDFAQQADRLPPPSPWPMRRRVLAFGAMAAGVAVLGTRALMAPEQAAEQAPLTLATAKGEFRKVPLADQSLAVINSASQVELRFSGQARRVRLAAGEVWFQVAKDKSRPFTVEAGVLRVEAVGTAFAVRRHGEGAEVLVTEGTVAVWSGEGGQRRMLTAGERALVRAAGDDMTVERGEREIARRLAWREGKLVFMNQSLREAVADFNRYSAKPIVIADPRLEDKPLIGQYRTDAPERFARDVSTALKVPYAVTAREILIGRAS